MSNKNKRMYKRAIRILLAILLLASIVYIADNALLFAGNNMANKENGVLKRDMSLKSTQDSELKEYFENSARINVLLVGMNGNLTDTIMLASFDPNIKRADIISIPRDTYYPRKGYNNVAQKKINAAYNGKIVNTAEAVSDVLYGMPIDYYAIIDYKGIENIVDSMGGVGVNIPFDMYYKDDYDDPPLLIDIPEGYQVLNGKKAVEFLRFRKGSKGNESYIEGDIGRVKAQQEFVTNAIKKSLSFRLPVVAISVLSNIKSDVSIKDALGIGIKLIGTSSDDIYTYVLPGKSQERSPWYWIRDEKQIKQLVKDIYTNNTLVQED